MREGAFFDPWGIAQAALAGEEVPE